MPKRGTNQGVKTVIRRRKRRPTDDLRGSQASTSGYVPGNFPFQPKFRDKLPEPLNPARVVNRHLGPWPDPKSQRGIQARSGRTVYPLKGGTFRAAFVPRDTSPKAVTYKPPKPPGTRAKLR